MVAIRAGAAIPEGVANLNGDNTCGYSHTLRLGNILMATIPVGMAIPEGVAIQQWWQYLDARQYQQAWP